MSFKNLAKPTVIIITVFFVISCFLPNINCEKVNSNYMAVSLLNDSEVYASSPDWISNNPHYSTGAALTDFNKDGWLDLVVADGNDMGLGKVNVYYNDGDGSFPTNADWQSSDNSFNGHLDVADVNGDGWPDVAVSYLGTSSSFGPIARLYLNNEGTLSSLPDWESDIIGNSFGVDFGDMNNDGRPDLAVATGWSYSPQHFYKNYVYMNLNGNLESTPSWISDDQNHYLGTLWLDADNDGWMDLAFIGSFQETQIYHNINGELETTASWKTSDSSTQDGIMLTAGDVDNDGLPDLFATDNTQLGGSGLFKQYTGLEDGFFETTYSWNYYGNYGSTVELADINGDKKLDLATGSWWGNTKIFINDGTGIPSTPTWTSSSSSVNEKIVFGNVGPTLCERTITENFYPTEDNKLFYLSRQPIQYIKSVYCDDYELDSSEYCYSRDQGWVSIGPSFNDEVKIIYNYSRSLDMVVSNWDSSIGNYLYYNRLLDSDLSGWGELNWMDVEPGESLDINLNVANIGDPDSKLDWEIESYPEWGEWNFDPISGEDLTPDDGTFVVDVIIVAPIDGNSIFEGEVKIINKNDPDDYSIIDVYLSTSGPDLECEGELIWDNLNPGSKVFGSFTVQNIGKEGSSLDWEIDSNPEWGDWTFSNENGYNLRPEDGPQTINVEVIVPNEKNKDYTGKIIVINSLTPLDYDELDVVLNTPKNKIFKICQMIPIKSQFLTNIFSYFNRFIDLLN